MMNLTMPGRFTAKFLAAVAVFAIGLVAIPAGAQTTDPQQAAEEVDRLLRKEIQPEADETRAEPVSDAEFLKRVSLDVIGRMPDAEELAAFVASENPQKRATLIARLLDDTEYGVNWGRYWRDVIFYRRTEERSLLVATSTEQYLIDQLNANRGWNELAREFIVASGDAREDGRNGLIAAHNGEPEETVAEISRIFLGIQIQCAQCHDHPTDRWSREQFHELAAFFPRVAARPSGQDGDRTIMVVAQDRFPRFRRGNNNNRYVGTAEHRMPDLSNPEDPGTLMQPVFYLNGESLEPGATDRERRESLADWITEPDNEWFSKSLVNRMWAELVGEGFYDSLDDIGPDRHCMAPETLDYLSDGFTRSGNDLKWLMEVILSTETYQLKTRDRRGYHETAFLANCAVRLRGDQVFDALLHVFQVPEERLRGGTRGRYGFNRSPRSAFNLIFGYDPSDLPADISGSIPQALALMNSQFIHQALTSANSAMKRMLREAEDNVTAIDQLYAMTLGREPTAGERRICLRYLRQVGDREEAFEDIQWSLINSTEFLYRD